MGTLSMLLWVTNIIDFICKYMQRNNSNTLTPQNLSNSIQIIKQLQEIQALRIEIYKLKTVIRSQQGAYQSSMTSQQMITEKLITSLRMAIKNQISLKREQTIQQSHQFLCNAIQQCLFDLQNLCQLYSNSKEEWEREKRQSQLLSHSQSSKNYQVKKLNKNGQSVESVQKQLNLTNIRYQAQLKENDQLKRKLLQSFQQIKAIRSTNTTLQSTINQLSQKIKSKQNEIKRFSDENDRLMVKIIENQQISRKHVEYFKKKSEEIVQQNQRLVSMHRDAVYREKQLIKIAEEGEQEVQKLLEEGNRLKLQLQTFHFKINEVIQKQQKIKSLETIMRGNGLEQKSFRQIRNKIQTSQQLDSKSGLKASKKFNLQHFQQKLTNSSTSLVF